MSTKKDVEPKKPFNSILSFLAEVKIELKKVSWPSRKQATRLTLVVVTISVFIAGFISLLDFLFSRALNLTF